MCYTNPIGRQFRLGHRRYSDQTFQFRCYAITTCIPSHTPDYCDISDRHSSLYLPKKGRVYWLYHARACMHKYDACWLLDEKHGPVSLSCVPPTVIQLVPKVFNTWEEDFVLAFLLSSYVVKGNHYHTSSSPVQGLLIHGNEYPVLPTPVIPANLHYLLLGWLKSI